MGKKLQGAKLRAKKRARELLDELQEQQAETSAQISIVTKANDELFTIDTKGTANNNNNNNNNKSDVTRPAKVLKKITRSGHGPTTESEQIEKWMNKYDRDAEKLAEVARQGKEQLKSRHRKTLRGNTQAAFDLWSSPTTASGEDSTMEKEAKEEMTHGIGSTWAGIAPKHCTIQPRKMKAPTTAKVALDVAKSGQSYRPDPEAHQIVLKTAVQVELIREKAILDKNTPLDAKGMSAETKAILLGDDDESSSDEDIESNEKDDNALAMGPLPKRADKKTRAQRNKEKRLRQERAVITKRKQQVKFLKQVSEVQRFAKELKKKDREREEEKKKFQEQMESSSKPLGADLNRKLSSIDPIGAPSLPVALPSEILRRNTLRTVKPKGNIALECMASLMDRKLAPAPTRNTNHIRGKRRKKNVKVNSKD